MKKSKYRRGWDKAYWAKTYSDNGMPIADGYFEGGREYYPRPARCRFCGFLAPDEVGGLYGHAKRHHPVQYQEFSRWLWNWSYKAYTWEQVARNG